MYKPPENTNNRVKSIKSKFENIEKNQSTVNIKKEQNGARGELKLIKSRSEAIDNNNSRPVLSRQFSDPAKLKRTPAFRLDKNVVKSDLLERSAPHNRSYYFDSKIKQFNSALKNNCDSNRKNQTDCFKSLNSVEKPENRFVRPLLVKSKSSHDFAYIRNKFNNSERLESNNNMKLDQREEKKSTTDISMLYTEPIPKSLRNNNNTCDKPVYSNIENLKKVSTDIHNSKTLRISDLKENPESSNTLTDTLKLALKKPLPLGPPPKKPPRTFEHTTLIVGVEKQSSFLHLPPKAKTTPNETPKKDPRYMLSKLEQALRNNKIRKNLNKKPETAAEDNSVSFKTRDLPEIPLNSSPQFNLNCFNGMTLCKATTYEKIGEPNSSFFLENRDEEPVYAEPFNFSGVNMEKEEGNGVINGQKSDKAHRNSLYYMVSVGY